MSVDVQTDRLQNAGDEYEDRVEALREFQESLLTAMMHAQGAEHDQGYEVLLRLRAIVRNELNGGESDAT